MEKIMLVRLKPHDPKKGLLLKQYTYQGIRFQAGRGWYQVNRQVAAYLKNVHSIPGDEDTPLAFDVCTPDQARAMDENDRKAARQVLPAEEPLDVSHVGEEQPRAKSRPSPDNDNTSRRQRSNSDRLPENAQPDALEVDDVEDETPRRRPSRRRANAMSRRPRATVEDSDESDDDDDLDGDGLEEEARPRRPSRRRAGVVSRRSRADDIEDDDEPEDDELDDEDDAFEEEAPRRPARRGHAGAVPRRRLRADVEDFKDEELDDDEFDDEVNAFDDDQLDEELEDDTEAAPPSPRRRRSLPPRSRAPQVRRIQRYAVEHDALDDDDRQTRRVRGARQAEALEALRIREAHRTRQQRILEDQYEQMPARRVQEDAVGSELDDEPTQKLPRSRSQGRHQDELHIRHARQMAAKLEEIDALDDAMSYGDAEDSLPNNATRKRHNGQGDAEDSLPARVRPSQGDAEDSLSTRNRHSYGDAEDSLPHRRMQHEVAPSSRHTADAQDDLDAVDQELDRRNVEEPARSDARSQRAQQPPSSAAHDELDALDDALDDSLEKASEDQRPGSAQPQHGPQHTGSSTQRSPEGAHDATSGAVSRDSRQPWPDDDPFVNRDTRHQAPAPGHEPVTAASANPRQGRRIYVPGPNTQAPASEAQASRPQPRPQRRTV